MSTWWTSLADVERTQIIDSVTAAMRRTFRADYEREAEARNEYARYFVREHFLTRDYEKWRACISPEDIDRYLLTVRQKGYEWTWRDCGHSRGYWVSVVLLEADEIPEGLPPTGSDNVSAGDLVAICQQEYREGKRLHDIDQDWRWLIAEATYHRLLNEALVRSYGVDVKAP